LVLLVTKLRVLVDPACQSGELRANVIHGAVELCAIDRHVRRVRIVQMLGKQTTHALVVCALALCGCDRGNPEPEPKPASAAAAAPIKVDFRDKAMGTEIHIIAYSSPGVDEAKVRAAIGRAHAEIVRLERLMTTWRDDSELAELNRRAGEAVKLSADTLAVLDKSIWAGRISDGTFDVTYAIAGRNQAGHRAHRLSKDRDRSRRIHRAHRAGTAH
jgi:thiamine biosynthesis lipoprotein ApbE